MLPELSYTQAWAEVYNKRRNPSYCGIKSEIVRDAFNLPRCVGKPNKDGLPLDLRGPVSGWGKGIQSTFLVWRFMGVTRKL